MVDFTTLFVDSPNLVCCQYNLVGHKQTVLSQISDTINWRRDPKHHLVRISLMSTWSREIAKSSTDETR